jgi:CheY-like chemotaxis protein/HPt (histidine-containing phosphotransfer) domain-containing protein
MLSKTECILLSSGGLLGENEYRNLGLAQSLLKPVRQSQLFDAISSTLNPTERTVATREKSSANLPSYAGKKLLVVEDNKVNQKVIIGMLAKFDIVPDIAENGRLALEQLEQQGYDLILMDCQMPVLDGYQTTRQLRLLEQQSPKPRQTVVALTANVISGEQEKCLAAGMDDYLTKPISQQGLADMLERWLNPDALKIPPTIAIANTVQNTAPLWDKGNALKYLGDDEELLVDMIIAFLADAPHQIAVLQSALKQQDFVTLGEMAHTLKGALSYFSTTTAMDYAATLEHAARHEIAGDYQQMTANLTEAMQALMVSFHEFIANAPKLD